MSPPVWPRHVTWVIWCQNQSLACSCVHLVEKDAIRKFSVPQSGDLTSQAHLTLWPGTVCSGQIKYICVHTVLGTLLLQLQQGLRLCSCFCKDYLDALRMNRAIKAKFWNLCNGWWGGFVWKLQCSDPGLGLGLANSIYKAFFYIYTVSFQFLCYQKYIFSFHTISSLCLFLFRVALPSSTQGWKERGKASYSQTRPSISIQTNPFCFPSGGQMTASLLKDSPQHSTACF